MQAFNCDDTHNNSYINNVDRYKKTMNNVDFTILRTMLLGQKSEGLHFERQIKA